MLFWDSEQGAECYGGAADKEQAAGILGEDVRQMILGSEALRQRAQVYTTRVVDNVNQAFFRIISSTAQTKHGFRPHLIVLDELHAHRDRRFYATLKAGLMKSERSMMVCITTAGEFDEEAICWQEHEYARAVIDYTHGDPDGIEDLQHYAVIYSAEDGDDAGDPEVWRRCNPNYGITVKESSLAHLWTQAQASPAAIAEFKQLHLNVWGQSAASAFDVDAWRACSAEPICEGPCYLGMDLSSKLDLTALVGYWPETYSVRAWFWLPGDNLEQRKKRDVFDYPRMVREGYITATEGSIVDFSPARILINELVGEYDVREIGFDPHNASQMFVWLYDEDGLDVVEIPQRPGQLSEPTKEAVGLVRNRQLRHGGNPVLSWCIRNTRVRVNANDESWFPVKDKTGRKRIDGAVAWINALHRTIAAGANDRDGRDFVMGAI